MTTHVTIGGGGTKVSVTGGSAHRVTLDRRTAAVIADRRQSTVLQPKPTAVDVTARNPAVHTGGGMGVQGPQGEPGPPGADAPGALEDTDALPEGGTNLYFTDERAWEAVTTWRDAAHFLASPTSTPGVPSYRPIVSGDLPPVDGGFF